MFGFLCGRDLRIQKTTQNWVGLNGRLLEFAHSPNVPSKELAYPTFRKGKSSSILLFQGHMLLPRSNFFDSRENSHGIGLLSPLPPHPPAKRFCFVGAYSTTSWRNVVAFMVVRFQNVSGCFQNVPKVRFVSKKDGISMYKQGVDFSSVAIN